MSVTTNHAVSATTNTNEQRLDLVDVVLFGAAIAACAWLLREGGFAAIVASMIGGAFGALRPSNRGMRFKQALRSGFAALWAGIFLTGMVSFGLTQ